MRIYLLAAGSQTRWGAGHVKQLARVEGRPLLVRTVDQCREIGVDEVTVITHKNKIERELVEHCRVIKNTYAPGANPSICDTVLDAFKDTAAGDDVALLCADVVFELDALRKILHDDAQVRVHGQEYEIFAVTAHGLVGCDRLRTATLRARDWGLVHVVSAKLWHVYRGLAGFGVHEHELEKEIFAFVRGYTQDLDRPVEYERFLKEHAWAR